MTHAYAHDDNAHKRCDMQLAGIYGNRIPDSSVETPLT